MHSEPARRFHGRTRELELLLAALERVSTGGHELVLIAGEAGMGKSRLLEETGLKCGERKAVVAAGRCDPVATGTPGRVIMHALSRWGDPLLPAQQSPAAQRHLVRGLARRGHPLVLLLDDLQWVDLPSLNLLKLLAADAAVESLLIVGTYRSADVTGSHPLLLTVDALVREGCSARTIPLLPLDTPHITTLAAQTLDVSELHAASLPLGKAAGNPLFLQQWLATLQDRELIRRTSAVDGWEWTVDDVKDCRMPGTVPELVEARLRSLPAATQRALQRAACLGHTFNMDWLAMALAQTPQQTARDLAAALQQGFVVSTENVSTGHFPQAQFHCAAYALMDAARLAETHLVTGQRLLAGLSAEQRDASVFDVVHQLNLGAHLILDLQEQDVVLRLNLAAATRARTMAAPTTALLCLKKGLGLLRSDGWSSQYPLALELHQHAAEAALRAGHVADAEQFCALVHRHARVPADEAAVIEVEMDALIRAHRPADAVRTGVAALRRLGVDLPTTATQGRLLTTFMGTAWTLRGRRMETLGQLPPMTDAAALAAMRILDALVDPAALGVPDLLALLACEQVSLTARYGHTSTSAYVYARYARLLSGRDAQDGQRAGAVALELLQRFPESRHAPRVLLHCHGHVRPWSVDVRSSLQPLLDAWQGAVDAGDLDHASEAAVLHCIHALVAGPGLGALEQRLAALTGDHALAVWHHTVRNLAGHTADPTRLSGTMCNAADLEKSGNRLGLFHLHFNRMVLEYLFGEPARAVQSSAAAEKCLDMVRGQFLSTLYFFYDTLIQLGFHDAAPVPERRALLRRVAQHQKLLAGFAAYSPVNFLHQVRLVEAEVARVQGRAHSAATLYHQAIDLARTHGRLAEEALGYELSAAFHRANNLPQVATSMLLEARARYQAWGAVAKVADLNRRHAAVLPPERPLLPRPGVTPHQPALDLATILEAVPVGVVVLAANGETYYTNEAGRKILGRSRMPQVSVERLAEVYQAYVAGTDQLFPSDQLPVVQALQGRRANTDRMEIQQGDRRVPVEVTATPIVDAAGKVVCAVAAFQDMTEHRRAQKLLEDANRTLEQDVQERTRAAASAQQAAESANQAKSAFLANMSHEIRTPLTALLGFADLLAESRASDRDWLRYATIIRRNGQHLLAVINDVLDLSKVEAGKLVVEIIDCWVLRVLRDVEALMRVRAEEAGLEFRVHLATAVPVVIRSDPTRLRQILLNLVGNAIKFTRKGSVRVTARYNEDATPPLLSLEVADTGIGISPEQMERLFQPFQQGDASMNRRFGGSGLGLAICKPLAESLGGDITVQSTPGKGSTFTFNLRVVLADGSSLSNEITDGAMSMLPPSEEPPTALTGRVLLAEDGPDNQLLLTALLHKAGLNVTVVENGQEAVSSAMEAWQHGRAFDAVLMDMQMPVVDGYTATTQLRKAGYHGPILALTAHAMAGEQERCLAVGCSAYLSKPVDRVTLMGTLARYLKRARRVPQHQAPPPLVSRFVDDPELADVLKTFVSRLPERVTALRAEGKPGSENLTRLVHQLKGAAGGYGFDPISHAAARLEDALRDQRPWPETERLLEDVIGLCERVRDV